MLISEAHGAQAGHSGCIRANWQPWQHHPSDDRISCNGSLGAFPSPRFDYYYPVVQKRQGLPQPPDCPRGQAPASPPIVRVDVFHHCLQHRWPAQRPHRPAPAPSVLRWSVALRGGLDPREVGVAPRHCRLAHLSVPQEYRWRFAKRSEARGRDPKRLAKLPISCPSSDTSEYGLFD